MGTVFSMNDQGWFHIKVGDKVSKDVNYEGIAQLEVDGRHFFAVSDYYAGYFPTEKVLEWKETEMGS
jgi:hypothetical protein